MLPFLKTWKIRLKNDTTQENVTYRQHSTKFFSIQRFLLFQWLTYLEKAYTMMICKFLMWSFSSFFYYVSYLVLISWKIQKTTDGWCKLDTSILLSLHSFTNSVTFQCGILVAHVQSFWVGCQEKLLLFVRNTMKMFQIQWYNLFLWI